MKKFVPHFFLILLFLNYSNLGIAQQEKFEYAFETTEKGMEVLALFAGSNLTLSGVYLLASDQNSDFHRTNLAWNGINGLIAGLSFIGIKRQKSKNNSQASHEKYLKKQRNIVWLNAGIDLFYIGFGIWRRTKNIEIGNAIIYNGSFLLVFDSLFGLALHNKMKTLRISPLSDGLGIVYSF